MISRDTDLVELVAVVEEELVGGLHARLDAVLNDSAGPRRTRQLLNLEHRTNGERE